MPISKDQNQSPEVIVDTMSDKSEERLFSAKKDFLGENMASALSDSVDIKSETKLSQTNSLEQWAKSIFEPENNLDAPTTAELSRFGLKTPQDVIRFLKSPAGETVIAEMGAQLAEEKALERRQQLMHLEHSLLIHRLMSLLFLWYLNKETHASEQIRDLIQQQNQRAIENAGSQPSSRPSSTNDNRDNLRATIANYERALQAVDSRRAALQQEQEELKKEESKLAEQGKSLEEKYDTFEEAINDFEQPEEEELTAVEIEERIAKITEEMNAQVVKLFEIVEENAETLAFKNAHNALNLKLANYHDRRAVMQGEKIYVDEEGQTVTSFKKAAFIFDIRQKDEKIVRIKDDIFLLKSGQDSNLINSNPELAKRQYEMARQNTNKIVKENDKLYLLKPGQDWNSVKGSPELKHQAQKEYDDSKQDLMTVKKIIHYHKGAEHSMHDEKVEAVRSKSANNIEEIRSIDNHRIVLESNMATANALLNSPQLSQTIPKPASTSISTSNRHALNQAPVTAYYRTRLNEIKSKAEVYFKDLEPLLNALPQSEEHKSILRNIPRSGPIPFQTMQSILTYMERFGIDATNPAVTKIQNPSELANQNNMESNREIELTPFNMNPSPFKRP
ncbi:MAG TPA: hypothetical protein PK657_05315 [Legionella sp.]|nr:hypothetical protein [Legionella sp.]